MLRKLHDLHQMPVGGKAREKHPGGLEVGAVVAVELEAVAVPLGDLPGPIEGGGAAALRQKAGIAPQAHGAALGGDAHLLRHQGDDRVLGGLGELGGVGVLPADNVPGKLRHRHLHPQADAKVGDAVLPGVPGRRNHALDAPAPEAAGHQDAAAAGELLPDVLRRQGLGVHPADLCHGVVGGARVVQGLHYREVGVVELGVLAHQGDLHLSVDALLPLHHGAPLPEVRLGSDEPQLPADHGIQPLLRQQQGDLIEGLGGGVLNDALRRHVAEEGDLPAHILADGLVAAADQDVRLDAQ